MHEIAIAKRIACDVAILEAAGFFVHEPSRLSEINALMEETGRPHQSAMLSMKNNDFTSASGIFLFLKKGGETVAGCRSKMIDLQDESFESHQRRALQEWYDSDELISVAPNLNRLIFGKHAYLGELEFKKGHRGRREIASAFARILLASSLMKWPDITCAYCILPDSHKRIHLDYGFCHFTRNAFMWGEPNPPGGRLHDWGVAVSSRADLIHDLTNGYWG